MVKNYLSNMSASSTGRRSFVNLSQTGLNMAEKKERERRGGDRSGTEGAGTGLKHISASWRSSLENVVSTTRPIICFYGRNNL